MAEAKSGGGRSGAKKKDNLIDPLYQKYTKSVIRALGSTEFYAFFMDAVSKADNRFQFSNRKMEKTVDLDWVDAIEEALPAFQNIVASPRNIIREDELVVNVANAKKAGADVVRHLAQHAELVDKFDDTTGDVQPSKLMQKYREDTVGLYENRLVFTALEMSYEFVKIRHDALFSAMSDEFGAKLKVDSQMETATEMVRMDMFLHIKETDSAIETDEKNAQTFARISKLYRILSMLMHSQFAQMLAKLPRIKGAFTKTNVLKKNPDYRKIVRLLEFLRNYHDIGYTIRVVEQNPQINEVLQQDIYHNILFNYLILKGYLEDERDRRTPAPVKTKKRSLKPKFIKEIIEELTEDYDLPDIEIRKVLIEELTREQLMLEEEAERRRLVEEQEARKREEEEKLRKEKEAEQQRLLKEKEEEQERLRQEHEAEKRRLHMERMEREAEDRRRSQLLREELDYFQNHLQEKLDARKAAMEKQLQEKLDFENAALLMDEGEQRRNEADAREKKRLQDQQEKLRKEKLLEDAKALLEEEKRKEQERLEAEAKQREEEARQEQLRKERDAQDAAATQIYLDEVVFFLHQLPTRKALREEEQRRIESERLQREQERQRRLNARQGK